MSEVERFRQEVKQNIEALGRNAEMKDLSRRWVVAGSQTRYTYNFTWMGRPIIQFPQDIVALQEIIWATRPQVVFETGIAHGGSLIFHASMLQLLGEGGRVIGVDIDIRAHNRAEIEKHPMSRHITLIQGSSIDPAVAQSVRREVGSATRVMVVLDSNHTHEHVLAELRLYSPLVKAGSYLVVLDTAIDDMPPGSFADRPWGPGNSPKTAVRQFLKENSRFEVDQAMQDKLLITVAPEGFLRCVRD